MRKAPCVSLELSFNEFNIMKLDTASRFFLFGIKYSRPNIGKSKQPNSTHLRATSLSSSVHNKNENDFF